jgi:hypothetical protein
MKRVTVLFDDERLYRELKAEAAKEGRPVKDVVAEALSDWLRRKAGLSPAERERWQALLREADELRRRQRVHDSESIEDALWAIRDERS